MKLIKFGAEWCKHCHTQDDILKDYNLTPVDVVDCDNDENDLCGKYNIMNIPTMVLVDDNDNLVERFVGVVNLNDLNNKIREYL